MRTTDKGPDEQGHFGVFGGRYVSETLMAPLLELTEAYEALRADPAFWSELEAELRDYVGRPTPLYEATRLAGEAGGARIFLKREDLAHTGAHKINNTIGQALLARHMGKRRLIAETGAGQHGVATATVAARMGLECIIYMGAEDMRRQSVNVYRMRMLGAEVVGVRSTRTRATARTTQISQAGMARASTDCLRLTGLGGECGCGGSDANGGGGQATGQGLAGGVEEASRPAGGFGVQGGKPYDKGDPAPCPACTICISRCGKGMVMPWASKACLKALVRSNFRGQ